MADVFRTHVPLWELLRLMLFALGAKAFRQPPVDCAPFPFLVGSPGPAPWDLSCGRPPPDDRAGTDVRSHRRRRRPRTAVIR